MPAKFSVYRVACIINLLLISGYTLLLNYAFFVEAFDSAGFGVYILFMLIFSIYAWNNILGLGMLRRYKNQEGLSPLFGRSVIIAFILQLLLQILLSVLIADIIVTYSEANIENPFYRKDYWVFMVQLIPITVFLLTIYCEIMTFPLIRAVRKREIDLLKELDHLGNT